MSVQISAFLGRGFLRLGGIRARDSLKRSLEGFFAVVGFKLARLGDELLALRASVWFWLDLCHSNSASKAGSVRDLFARREVRHE